MASAEGKSLGKVLKRLRQQLEKKQEDVAKALGIPTPTYSSWERGRTEPNIAGLLNLSRYYGTDVTQLLSSIILPLRIGSWYPLMGRFHPINNPNGFYTLIYWFMFNRLYFFDIMGQRFYSELIESWSKDDKDKDNASYTFFLRRDDVRFHGGRLLELEDVKYSYEQHIEQYPFFKQFIESINIKREDYAIELKFRRNKWLGLEHIPAPYIVQRRDVNKTECFEGTGPWLIRDDQQRLLRNAPENGLPQPVTLEANLKYFGSKPKIKEVEYNKFENQQELEEALKEGDVDLGYNCEVDDPDRFNFQVNNSSTPHFLVFNKEVCKDGRMREAVALAINRKRIDERFGQRKARSLPAEHLYLILRDESLANGAGYDPKRAKELWKEATADLKEEFSLKISTRPDDYDPLASELAEEVVEQLKSLGMKAKEEADIGNAHAWVELIALNQPRQVYNSLHSTKSYKYSNEHVDLLLKNIETDTYRQLQKLLSAEHVIIPLIRRGVVITYTKALMTHSRLREGPNALYGPNAVHWELLHH